MNLADLSPWEQGKLKAEAKQKPNGWVYQIDWDYPEEQFVPPEAIIRAWEVDGHGELTGNCRVNENYRPVIRTERQPQDYMIRALAPHMFGQWLPEIDPAFHHTFPDVPDHAFVGSWYLDKSGTFTGEFRSNPKYEGDIEV